MEFEWDEIKHRTNIAKHGISFLAAARIFDKPVLPSVDSRRDYGETRHKVIGMVDAQALVVIYTMRGETCRIISARRARRDERRAYRQVYP